MLNTELKNPSDTPFVNEIKEETETKEATANTATPDIEMTLEMKDDKEEIINAANFFCPCHDSDIHPLNDDPESSPFDKLRALAGRLKLNSIQIPTGPLSKKDNNLFVKFVDNAWDAMNLIELYSQNQSNDGSDSDSDDTCSTDPETVNKFYQCLGSANEALQGMNAQPWVGAGYALLAGVAAAASIAFAWPVFAAGALAYGLSLAAGIISVGATATSILYFNGLFSKPQNTGLEEVNNEINARVPAALRY